MQGQGASFDYSVSEFGGYKATIKMMTENTDVVFPSQYKGKDIVEIGGVEKYSFDFCPTSVTIPASVKNINKNAFWECKLLKRVILEEGSQLGVIENGAFRDCSSLEEINLSNAEGCRVISDWAFSDCSSLKEIYLPESLIVLGEYAFHGCASLESLTFHPEIEFPDIKNSTFWGCCALTKVAIPRDVERIEKCAFWGCSALSGITFAEGSLLKHIGESAFSGTAIAELDLSPCVYLVLLDKSMCRTDALSKVIFPVGCRPKVEADAFRQDAVEFVNKPNTCQIRGKNEKKGACYVATCVYGSYDCPEVWVLRRYRDTTLSSNAFGRCFIGLYYAVSPTLIKRFGKTRIFRCVCKKILDKMISTLQNRGVQSTPYEDK